MTEILPCVEIEPEGEPQGSIVWLHGLGASGHDFEDVVPLLELPGVRYVFPHAPARPVTINMGLIMPAWYDIERLDGPRGHANDRHVKETTEQVRALLEREEERGLSSSRVALAGFSQGGAVALHVGVRYEKPLAGIMVLSAYELQPDTRPAEESPANRTTPMLFAHGTQDPLVAVERGRAAYEAYHSPERPTEWHEFPMAHQVSMEEIRVIRKWLHGIFVPAAPAV